MQPVVDDDGFCRIPDQANIGINAGPAFGALGILAALVRARTTGEGACMEIAQSDAAAYFDWYRIETWKGYDERPDTEVTGNASDNYERRAPGLGGMYEGVRYQVYESADGHVLFMASEQAFWKNFCEGVGRKDLFEKYPGSEVRRPRARQRRAAGDPARHLPARARSPSGSRSPTSTTRRSPPSTPRRRSSTTRSSRTASRGRRREQIGAEQLLFPLHVDGEELPVPTKAPEVGEHTDDVLARVLGYDADRIAKLRATGALG